jgi:methylmalonyl-CoA/ethylmalonyl-CoA epimerase
LPDGWFKKRKTTRKGYEMIEKIDHIAIAVKHMEDTLNMYRRAYGLETIKIETYEEVKTKIAFIPVDGCEIHILTPTEPGAGMIGQFLEEKGEGVHHIGLKVDDIESTMGRLEQSHTPCMNKIPMEVGDGSRVAFTNPLFAQNVLYELMEKRERNTE